MEVRRAQGKKKKTDRKENEDRREIVGRKIAEIGEETETR